MQECDWNSMCTESMLEFRMNSVFKPSWVALPMVHLFQVRVTKVQGCMPIQVNGVWSYCERYSCDCASRGGCYIYAYYWWGSTAGIRGNIEMKPHNQDDPNRRKPDITKAQVHLHWKPTVSNCTVSAHSIHWQIHSSTGQLVCKISVDIQFSLLAMLPKVF